MRTIRQDWVYLASSGGIELTRSIESGVDVVDLIDDGLAEGIEATNDDDEEDENGRRSGRRTVHIKPGRDIPGNAQSGQGERQKVGLLDEGHHID